MSAYLRKKLFQVLDDEIYVPYFRSMMKNLSLFQAENRFYNWYHGYTKISCPYYDGSLVYDYSTTLPLGSYATPYFSSKMNKTLLIATWSKIRIFVPYSLYINKNFTLVLRKNFTSGSTHFRIDTIETKRTSLLNEKKYYFYHFDRQSVINDNYYYLRSMMPGFRLDWNYNSDIPILDSFSEEKITQLFVR